MSGAGHLPAFVQEAGEHVFLRCIDTEAMDWSAPFFRDCVPDAPRSHSLVPLAEWQLRQPARQADYQDVAVIFHVSHCGSTLLARNIAASGQADVLSEPAFFASLHGRVDAIGNPAARMQVSLAILEPWRAWAASRGKKLILKLSSQLNLFMPALMAAMPGARFVALHREPLPVLESLGRKRTQRLQIEAECDEPKLLPQLRGLDDDPYLLRAANNYAQSLNAIQGASDGLYVAAYDGLASQFPAILQHLRLDPGVAPDWSAAMNAKAKGRSVNTVYRPVSARELEEFAAAHSRLLDVAAEHYAQFQGSLKVSTPATCKVSS